MKINKYTGLVALTLLRSHAVYNKGETAGFLPGHAQQLIAAGAAVPFDPDAKAAVLPVVDDGAADALAARAAELDAREKALADREAALMNAPADKPNEPPAPADAAKTGAPPKQGSK
ncbi:hypothetical protein [Pseudotabrizicola sp. 4114]|uniref:hypothetical protein n=1 Tax=Pseudotabrizicola sp. 4114 TaxID=2817731 RepID=UPI0028594781|nr:hypothetical protein [Pseudorhodobacter sp. 4114]